MNRREAERLAHQESALVRLGFTHEEAASLRRISMALRRWHELECNGDVQRDERTGKTFAQYGGGAGPFQTVRCADHETGAKKRLLAIINAEAKRHGECRYSAYIQGDPRGAALYIIRPGDVPEGGDVSAYYSRGICVY